MSKKYVEFYQVVEEIWDLTVEPDDDITFPSEYIHRLKIRAIDELSNKGYKYKRRVNTPDGMVEYFFKKSLGEEHDRYENRYQAHIRILRLPKDEIGKYSIEGITDYKKGGLSKWK